MDQFIVACVSTTSPYCIEDDFYSQISLQQAFYLHKFQFVWDPKAQRTRLKDDLLGVDDLDLYKMLATIQFFEEASEPYPIPNELHYFKDLKELYASEGHLDFFGEKFKNDIGLKIWEG